MQPRKFSIGIWTFSNAAILSAHAHPPYNELDYPVPVHFTFSDWVSGLCSLGIFIVILINKDHIGGKEGFSDSHAVWRVRLFLSVGFALMADGLAGSVALLVLKYIIPGYPKQYRYYGYANVPGNVSLSLSAVALWIAQSGEYEYNPSV